MCCKTIMILLLQLCVCASVRPSGKVIRSYLTRVEKLAFFASLSFDVVLIRARHVPRSNQLASKLVSRFAALFTKLL